MLSIRTGLKGPYAFLEFFCISRLFHLRERKRIQGERGGYDARTLVDHHVGWKHHRGSVRKYHSSFGLWNAVFLILASHLDDHHTAFDVVDLCNGSKTR